MELKLETITTNTSYFADEAVWILNLHIDFCNSMRCPPGYRRGNS